MVRAAGPVRWSGPALADARARYATANGPFKGRWLAIDGPRAGYRARYATPQTQKAPAGSNPAGAVVRALARLLLTGETAKPAVALGIGTVAIDFCVCKGISTV